MVDPLTELTLISDVGVGKVTINEVQSQLGKLGLRIVSDAENSVLETAARQRGDAWLAAVAKIESVRDVVRLARAAGLIPALVLAQLDAVLAPEFDALAARAVR